MKENNKVDNREQGDPDKNKMMKEKNKILGCQKNGWERKERKTTEHVGNKSLRSQTLKSFMVYP